jgi:hypothetical protein
MSASGDSAAWRSWASGPGVDDAEDMADATVAGAEAIPKVLLLGSKPLLLLLSGLGRRSRGDSAGMASSSSSGLVYGRT